MKILQINASPRGERSNTKPVVDAFWTSLRAAHSELEVEVIDLYNHDLPSIAGDNIEARYTLTIGQPIDRNHAESWAEIEALIAQFKSADLHLISAPMWNLSIPYALKYYIDCIIQPGYVFTYDKFGQPMPLVFGKKMIVISSRGGDYSASPMSAYDFQEPYLRAIFGFIGITDIEFVHVQPTDINAELRAAALARATEQIRAVVASLPLSAQVSA